MGNWFVFYVQSGSEQIACNLLNKLINREETVAFVPQVELIFKNSRPTQKIIKPMFPGYVFADSEENERFFISQANKYVRFSKCIFKLLGDQSVDYMKLDDKEKGYLLSFYNEGYIIEESKGFIIGDQICITSGPLKGRESIIRKINRHKRFAEIEIECLGDLRRVHVALEIVSKTVDSCK